MEDNTKFMERTEKMVIVIGHTGYIGQQFMKELKARGIDAWGLSRSEYDYYNIEILSEVLAVKRPKFLINCAGYSGKPNVDACEENQSETSRANVMLPRVIAKACKEASVPWGHISSGCIYSGYEKEFTEDDAPNFSFNTGNCSFYSGTKAQGEEVIQKEGADYYIWRLRIPFDHYDGPRNYLSKMKNYDILLDVKNSVSHKEDFVQYCIDLWLIKAEYGIYNVTNTGWVTTREVTESMNEILKLNKDFQFFESEKHMFHLNAVKTPRSSCILDNTKLRVALESSGLSVRSAMDAIEGSLHNWIEEGAYEDSAIHGSFWK